MKMVLESSKFELITSEYSALWLSFSIQLKSFTSFINNFIYWLNFLYITGKWLLMGLFETN